MFLNLRRNEHDIFRIMRFVRRLFHFLYIWEKIEENIFGRNNVHWIMNRKWTKYIIINYYCFDFKNKCIPLVLVWRNIHIHFENYNSIVIYVVFVLKMNNMSKNFQRHFIFFFVSFFFKKFALLYLLFAHKMRKVNGPLSVSGLKAMVVGFS